MSNLKPKKRQRKIPAHRSFRITKKRFTRPDTLPSPLSLFRSTGKLIWSHKAFFCGIVVLQTFLTLIFIQGSSETANLSEIKQEIQDAIGVDNAGGEKLGTGFALFGYLATTTSTTSGGAASVYQFFLATIVSLATIWGVRQFLAGESPRIRDSFYKGMYPLIPFILVLFVVGLQLLPALLGNFVYSTVITNGLAVTAIEKVLWLVIFLLLLTLSLYMIVSSLFALYISTLPNMTPIKALRSARQLVLHRRTSVAIRMLCLPFALFFIAVVVFVPLLIIATGLAQPLFLLFSSAGFVIAHTYMYHLYRSLL